MGYGAAVDAPVFTKPLLSIIEFHVKALSAVDGENCLCIWLVGMIGFAPGAGRFLELGDDITEASICVTHS